MNIISNSAPTTQDPTTIEYCRDDKQYHVRAYGLDIDREWSIGAAETTRQAWLASYEGARACICPRRMRGVQAIADEIGRITGGRETVWHIDTLSRPWQPAPMTWFVAVIKEGVTVELWALSSDGRLATLECVFVDTPALQKAVA